MNEQTQIQIAEREIMDRLQALEPTRRQLVLKKLVAAALGSIPWIGGFMAASISYREESAQKEVDNLQRQWLQEHKERMEKLALELAAFTARLNSFGDEVNDRLKSESYLALIRKGFRTWDQADTDQKRSDIGKLLANAGGTKLCDDEVIRLFLDWLERYHEAHFKVIREVFQNPGSTRYDIWQRIHGELLLQIVGPHLRDTTPGMPSTPSTPINILHLSLLNSSPYAAREYEPFRVGCLNNFSE